jgi:hypothetical protein
VFDWATDIDQSIGPVPKVSDFRPTTPPQPIRARTPALGVPSDPIVAASAPTSCTPAAYTPAAPAHSVQASTAPVDPVLVEPDKPAPCLPDVPVTPSQPVCTPPEPTVTPSNSDVASRAHSPATPACTETHAHTPSITHGPRDLSVLRSGTKNPWGSIQRRRNSPRNWTAQSDSRGSLRNHHSRSYPPRQYYTNSDPDPVQYSVSHPRHPEQLQPSRKWSLYSNLHSRSYQSKSPLQNPQQYSPLTSNSHPHPIPVNIQIIQHPRGISPEKPKITKIIPPTPAKIQKNSPTPCCACGNIIPAYRPDRRSWRSMDSRGRRFRRRFSVRFWQWERGRSHSEGGEWSRAFGPPLVPGVPRGPFLDRHSRL